jgi:trehalose 6-phosphate synthase
LAAQGGLSRRVGNKIQTRHSNAAGGTRTASHLLSPKGDPIQESTLLKTILTRFALPVLVLAVVATIVVMPFIDRLIAEWFRGDAQLRASVIMKSIEQPLVALMNASDERGLARYLERVTTDERLVAVLVCGPGGRTVFETPLVPRGVACSSSWSERADAGSSEMKSTTTGSVLVSRFPLPVDGRSGLHALLVHDLGYADRRRSNVRDYLFAFLAVGGIALSLSFVVAAWWSLRRWASALVNDIRGGKLATDARSPSALSMPILAQVRKVLREVEENQRLEIDYQENWTPVALKHLVERRLDASEMLVVSNREPYIHNLDAAGHVHVQVPASGMVTALEPVIRACAGTWIAHGSGSADRQVVDRNDGVRVPPDRPSYRLRRVWLSGEQESGYYYGFSNEGLWPLCHLAYVRPQFRESDWQQYVAVNQRFAAVVAEEARTSSPVLLIQDYHFGLLPAYVRQHRPNATIVQFWHIPWPNAETFGVCPWKVELLLGLLRADILGFHTRYHCQNFLASVDRYVECQIDHEHMTVTVQGHVCQVAAYPISIEWPPRMEATAPDVATCRQNVRRRFGIEDGVAIGVGIERWDFTKGILERFAALEHLLATRPGLRGRVSLLQVAAPSRGLLASYKALQEQTLREVERINGRFGRPGWQPIVLVAEHQEPDQVFELHRAADFCIVNSLHDGMNLVAKEFVASRDDEDGVLILSTFAGASRELVEALLVNPYDVVETAAAMETALRMTREERSERMRLMRHTVKQNNVFRWAGRMLVDAAQVRQRQKLATRATRSRIRLSRAVQG